jgi:hypothetical protein
LSRPTKRRATATAGCCASWIGGACARWAAPRRRGRAANRAQISHPRRARVAVAPRGGPACKGPGVRSSCGWRATLPGGSAGPARARTCGAPSLTHGPRQILVTRSTLQRINPPKHTQKMARGLPYVLNVPLDDSLAALSSSSLDDTGAAWRATTHPRPRHTQRERRGAAGKAYQRPAPRVIHPMTSVEGVRHRPEAPAALSPFYAEVPRDALL